MTMIPLKVKMTHLGMKVTQPLQQKMKAPALDSSYTLAERTVLEESITVNEVMVFPPTSSEFVHVDVENIILNLPAANDFMEIP